MDRFKPTPLTVVVRPHRPVRKLLILGLVGVSVLGLGWFTVERFQWQLLRERLSAVADRARLGALREEAERENARLREQLEILERSGQVDKQAYAEVQGHLRELQEQVGALREEVEFYRGVLKSAGTTSGLGLQGVKIERRADAERFGYRMVLTNLDETDGYAKGSLAVLVEGTDNGREERLDLSGRLVPGSDPLAFEFRHFARLRGEFILPAGFEPERLVVQLQQEGQSQAAVEKTYDWSKLLK